MSFDHFLKEASPALGLQWRKYRRRSARHRVEARMSELGIEDFAGYLSLIRSNPAEAAALPDLMRVTVSRFFRERECWDFLSGKIIPYLLEGLKGETFRAWSAGCCGGEEPYSLAIVWLERFRPIIPDVSLEILATDIDASALSRARRGVYAKGSLREVPRELLERYFVPERELYKVKDEVRRLVRFEERNLLNDAPPKNMDLVMCRYLAFTYYVDKRLESAANNLKASLRPGGVLMVGLKEADVVRHGLIGLDEGGCFYRVRPE